MECFQKLYDYAELRACCTVFDDLIEELYGFNGMTKVELKERKMKYYDIIRYALVLAFWLIMMKCFEKFLGNIQIGKAKCDDNCSQLFGHL